MGFVAQARTFGRSASQGVRRAPFVHVVAVGTLAIALFAAGLAYSAQRALDRLIASMGDRVQVTVYLRDDAGADRAPALAAELAKRFSVDAKAVPKQVALERLSKELGDLGAAVANLPENPLPSSVELTVPAGQRNPAALKSLAAQIRQIPEVADVDYGEQAVERLAAIARALRWAGLFGFALIAGATVAIISATLQLAIYARREEIEIQKLVGATDRFVKAPFLLEGLFQGVLGAGVACAGLFAFSLWATPRLEQLLAFVSLPASGPVLGWRLAGELFACGAALGLGGSFIAVGRFLRV